MKEKQKNKVQIHIQYCTIDDSSWLQITGISEGHVCATATVYSFNDLNKSPELCNMFVSKCFREEGIGSQILSTVRKELKELKRPLNLHCKVGSTAHQWYLRAGFIEIGEIVDEEIYMIDNHKNKEY